MGDRFPNDPCVFCSDPNFGVGEHVLPQWFLGDAHGEGPFTTVKNGVEYVALVDGQAKPVKNTGLPGLHVPACEQHNSDLDRYFEKAAKPVMRELVPRGEEPHVWPTLARDEVEAFARWMAKVCILSRHPAVGFDNPHVDRDPDAPRADSVPVEHLAWMPAGDPIPDGFSMFVTRRDLKGRGDAWEGERLRLVLPTVMIDTRVIPFSFITFRIKGLEVELVWHPGWPIVHPLVAEHRAARLWPEPEPIDFAGLPEVHADEFKFLSNSYARVFRTDAEFAAGQFDPLTATPDGKFTIP